MEVVPDSAQVINPPLSRNEFPAPIPLSPPSAPVAEQPLPQLYIDTSSKQFMIGIHATFIISAFIFLLCSVRTPKSQLSFKPNTIICSNPVIISSDKSIQCLPFDVYNNPNFATYVSDLGSYNQYMEIFVYFYALDMDNSMNIDDEVILTIFSTTESNGVYHIDQELTTLSVDVEIDSKSHSFKQNGKTVGYYQKLGYFREIPTQNLLLVSSIPSLTESVNIRNVTLQVRTANPAATRMECNIRIVFFCFSILTFAAYALRLSLMHRSRKVIEQRFVMTLGFTLILFNDPFFVITLTRPNNGSTYFSSLFNLIFPIVLIFFFMCQFQRADLQNSSKQSHVIKNPFKWMLITVTFLLLSVFYIYTCIYQSSSYIGEESPKNPTTYKVLKGFSLALITICYLTGFYHFVQVCLEYETKIQRHRTFLNVSIFYFFYSFIAFISSSFNIFNNWTSITFLNFTIFNSYIYILQFLYSPTKGEIRRKYPARLTNAQVMQRAGDYLASNYGMGEIGNVVGLPNNYRDGGKKYENMSDEVRTDYRWSSMNDGGGHQEEEVGRHQNISMPNINMSRSEGDKKQEQQGKVQMNPNEDMDKFQIGDDEERVEEEKYVFDEDNQHEKAVEEPEDEEEEENVENNKGQMGESVLLSFSESAIHPNIFPQTFVSQSDIARVLPPNVERETVSNILDDMVQGDRDQHGDWLQKSEECPIQHQEQICNIQKQPGEHERESEQKSEGDD